MDNYLAVNKKKILSVWVQFRAEGIDSFKGESFAQHREFIVMCMKLFRQRTKPSKTRHGQKRENKGFVRASLAVLLHLAESGPPKTIPDVSRMDEVACEPVGMAPVSKDMDTRVARTLAFETASSAIMTSRQLFVTGTDVLVAKSNHLGIGAPFAREGDQVWIRPGASVPFIL